MRGKYKFKVDFDAKQYIGIHLNWNYVDCTVRCSMREYAKQALEALKHMFTGKHYYAPSKIDRPDYRAKIQFAKINTAAPLSLVQIKHIERVIGKFLYYARAIDNTMLHALNDIARKIISVSGLLAASFKQYFTASHVVCVPLLFDDAMSLSAWSIVLSMALA